MRNSFSGSEIEKQRVDTLKRKKQEKTTAMAQIKRELAEIENQEEELQREVSLLLFKMLSKI